MYRKVQEAMQWRTDLVVAERFSDLASLYVYPAVVSFAKMDYVPQDAFQGENLFRQLAGRSRLEGTTRREARVIAVELPKNDHFRVWVLQTDHLADGTMLNRGGILQYCVLINGLIYTRMTDCRGWAEVHETMAKQLH